MIERQTGQETIYPNSHIVETGKGSITYSVIGEPEPDERPVIWVSGSEQSRLNPFDAAQMIARETGKQLLIYEQPVYDKQVSSKDRRDPKKAIDFIAESVLAAAEDAGFVGEGIVADTIAHSMGGLVLERMKQIAEERGIRSLDQSEGSKIVLIAPTGSRRKENMIKLGGRWVPYMVKGVVEGLTTLDPSGEKGKALQTNTFADLPKAIGETKAMAKQRIDYRKFGKALVLIYPEDRMFPENRAARWGHKRGFINESINDDLPLAFATPYGQERMPTRGLKRLKAKAAIGSTSYKEYVRSSRGAGHNHPTDKPEPTVETIIDYLDS